MTKKERRAHIKVMLPSLPAVAQISPILLVQSSTRKYFESMDYGEKKFILHHFQNLYSYETSKKIRMILCNKPGLYLFYQAVNVY